MFELNAFKVLSPYIHFCVYKGHRIDAVLLHQRMRCRSFAVYVELLLKECVNGLVKGELRYTRTLGTKFVVYIKTARALNKELNF